MEADTGCCNSKALKISTYVIGSINLAACLYGLISATLSMYGIAGVRWPNLGLIELPVHLINIYTTVSIFSCIMVRVFPSEYLVSRLRNYVVFVITIIPLQIICIVLEFCVPTTIHYFYHYYTWSFGCTASFPLTASFLGVICALVFK
ncbi:unnamed protein product, partial [Meganyctiphanes norvegica]